MYDLIKNVDQIPPCDQFRLGHQNDGSGHYYCVVVESPHGRIPGKGKQGKAWYSFGGKEHSSRNFHFLKVHHGKHVTLVKSRQPPADALITGFQNDSVCGTYYSVVCHHTGHGKVPGKSDGKSGWYSWGGKEHMTKDFSYVVVRGHGGHHGGFNPGPTHHHGGFVPSPIPPQIPDSIPPHHHGGFNPGPPHHHGGFNPGPPHHHGGFNPPPSIPDSIPPHHHGGFNPGPHHHHGGFNPGNRW